MKQNYKPHNLIAKISSLFLLFFLMLGMNQALVADNFEISIDAEAQNITFSWPEAVGTLSGSFSIGEQPFNTDGGFFLIQLFDNDDNLLVFADYFNEFSIGATNYHASIEDDDSINPGDTFTIMEYLGERFGKFEYIIALSSAFMPRIGLEDFRVTSNLIQTFGNDSLFFVIDYDANPDKSGGAITLTALQKAFEMIINPNDVDVPIDF